MTPDVLQMFKIKGQGHSIYRRMITKSLLIFFRKSGSLNLMTMSEFL